MSAELCALTSALFVSAATMSAWAVRRCVSNSVPWLGKSRGMDHGIAPLDQSLHRFRIRRQITGTEGDAFLLQAGTQRDLPSGCAHGVSLAMKLTGHRTAEESRGSGDKDSLCSAIVSALNTVPVRHPARCRPSAMRPFPPSAPRTPQFDGDFAAAPKVGFHAGPGCRPRWRRGLKVAVRELWIEEGEAGCPVTVSWPTRPPRHAPA